MFNRCHFSKVDTVDTVDVDDVDDESEVVGVGGRWGRWGRVGSRSHLANGDEPPEKIQMSQDSQDLRLWVIKW